VWVWSGVPPWQALPRVAVDRARIRRLPFARLLGTARGFAPRDADLTRWALVAVFPSRSELEAYDRAPVVRGWDAVAAQRARLVLDPRSSRGSWGGRSPFTVGVRPARPDSAEAVTGSVLALTRARLRAGHGRRFRRAVPPVGGIAGLDFAMGIGEWPVGLLGTLTLWSSEGALRSFAWGDPAHLDVVARTGPERWYREDLYARFAVLQRDGALA
jgi:hypothetical protein